MARLDHGCHSGEGSGHIGAERVAKLDERSPTFVAAASNCAGYGILLLSRRPDVADIATGDHGVASAYSREPSHTVATHGKGSSAGKPRC